MSSKQPKLTSVESESDSDQCETRAKPAKGIYVLPNLFTTAGLFAGFYAIMQARLGHFEAASLAIYAAMVMDILDGRLVRLTNTQSAFGSEYDSLSDMVSFGVAPAMVLFEFSLSELGRFGSLVTFVYIACAALRLARFNVVASTDKAYFTGMPSPGAAAIMASIVWVSVDYDIDVSGISGLLALVMLATALAMVSNIKYRSFKDANFRDQMPFVGLIIGVMIFALIYWDPPMAFLLFGLGYMLSGALLYVLNKFKHQSEDAEEE